MDLVDGTFFKYSTKTKKSVRFVVSCSTEECAWAPYTIPPCSEQQLRIQPIQSNSIQFNSVNHLRDLNNCMFPHVRNCYILYHYCISITVTITITIISGDFLFHRPFEHKRKQIQ